MRSPALVLALALGSLLGLAGCGGVQSVPLTASQPNTVPVAAPATTTPPPGTATTAPTEPDPFVRPAWLGTRVLPLRDDGFGEVRPTPPELAPRRLATIDRLPPPAGDGFESTIGPVPPDVVERSTWHEGCPVDLADLAYLTVSHVGFDGSTHTGEMITNVEFADGVVAVFEALFAAGFPIEEMRVIGAPELDLPPTGDGNVTTSFVCREAVGSANWSQHAYGLAIDLNPFHNPYLRGDLVLPELAGFYTDRDRDEAGMVHPDSVAVGAFADLGWVWGGTWSSLKDWMHFSATGR